MRDGPGGVEYSKGSAKRLKPQICVIRPPRWILIPVQNILGLKARSMEDSFGMFRSVSDTARTHGRSKQISQKPWEGWLVTGDR
jgi:hypothetical protein